MQNLPTISVIIPCYNAAETLRDAIESVVVQDYPNLEFMILDAGSKDGTVDIIKEFETHLSHWRSEPDGGPNAAYNEGIEKANGEVTYCFGLQLLRHLE